jgi:site-specific DNA-methyltransferase (adenine-specific)
MWFYGSGFPKSLNIGKAIDKRNGVQGDVVGTRKVTSSDIGQKSGWNHLNTDRGDYEYREILNDYKGWGTALKPAHEPIVMARKPFKGSVAENVLEHGTGGINIDECRVKVDSVLDQSQLRTMKRNIREVDDGWGMSTLSKSNPTVVREDGRFPANVMHDGSEVVQDVFGDKSRYFYCAKASKKDRDEGLDMIDEKPMAWSNQAKAELERGNLEFRNADGNTAKHNKVQMRKNSHPTVKPTKLMRYLCRLVTPKGGVVLDPFMGSGSTGKGALLEGFRFIGIEMEREYFDIACARLEAVQNNVQEGLF